MKNIFFKLLFFAAFLFAGTQVVVAQSTKPAEEQALLFLSQKQYDKALPLLRDLYQSAPFDKKFYDNYRDALIATKAYDTAVALGEYMSKIRREDLTVLVDMGWAYELKGKKKDAAKYYDLAVENINGNEFQLNALLASFRFYNNNTAYQIKAIEAFQARVRNPFMFGNELAKLYNEIGKTDLAIETLLNTLAVQPYGLENSKQSLDNMIGEDDKKLKKVQDALYKRNKDQPENPTWKALSAWLQMRSGNTDEALKTMIAQDKNSGSDGVELLQFAKTQIANDALDVALQAVEYIIGNNKPTAVLESAQLLRLGILQEKLEKVYPVADEKWKQLRTDYEQFFKLYPQYKNHAAVLQNARLLALHAHEPDTAITMLRAAIAAPYTQPQMVGQAKLDIGDYLILTGKVWEAALEYAQVDKMFKEDQLGEEARFRNAKLSYYRGDFEYAQSQLSVLKASTSELIANDALYLSVLITENTPEDKNYEVLSRFAYADLLQFQNKFSQAETLLDSLSSAFPESPMQDDIFLQRAQIAIKKQDYAAAVRYLETIQNKYGDDVLGDDATMRLAAIYEDNYKDKEKAMAQYEKLITTYPGSTFVQQARLKYDALKTAK